METKTNAETETGMKTKMENVVKIVHFVIYVNDLLNNCCRHVDEYSVLAANTSCV